MENLEIVEKAYRLDLRAITNGFQMYSDEIAFGKTRAEAKSKIFDVVEHQELILRFTDDKVTRQNIPVLRAKDYDVVVFEGENTPRYEIPKILHNRERNDELDELLTNLDVKYCYIKKHGQYYRNNYTGYTEYVTEAGVYRKEDAVDSAKRCDDLYLIPVDIEKHNELIDEKINKLKECLINE